MRPSLLSYLYARPELFRKGHSVYLRKPEDEINEDSRNALKTLRDQIGGGPFLALRIQDTPDSPAAPQKVVLAFPGKERAIWDGQGNLTVSGYYLASSPQ